MTDGNAESYAGYKMAKRQEEIDTDGGDDPDFEMEEDLVDAWVALAGGVVVAAAIGWHVATGVDTLVVAPAAVLAGVVVAVVGRGRASTALDGLAAPIVGAVLASGVAISCYYAGVLPASMADRVGVVLGVAFVSPGLAVLSGIGNRLAVLAVGTES